MEVRVLEDCGKVWTDSGPIALTKGSIVFVRRYQNLQTNDLVFRFENFFVFLCLECKWSNTYEKARSSIFSRIVRAE